MPVGVEQWRAAVGVMANSVAVKPQSPIGAHWKKWLKASDPVVYKGCIAMLVLTAQVVMSGLRQCEGKMQEDMKEGSECYSTSTGKIHVLAMRARPSAVLVKSFLFQLLVILCERILQLHCHTLVSTDACTTTTDQWMATAISLSSDYVWTRWFDPVQVSLMILLLPFLAQLIHITKQHMYLFTAKFACTLFKRTAHIKERLNCFSVCIYLRVLYVYISLPVLKRSIHSWASLMYRKCSKKGVIDGVLTAMSISFSDSVRTGVKMMTMIVFVNQMLLMMAGDVERNPGPGGGPEKNDELQVKAEIKKLQEVFIMLKDDVFEFVKDQPVDTFKVRLISMDVNGEEHHVNFLEEIAEKNDTVLKIWMKLSHYMNFLNYEILQHILQKYKDGDLQERMDEYAKQMEKFFMNTCLCTFVKCWPIRGNKYSEEGLLTAKIKLDWDTCTLEDLDNAKESLARKLFLPKFALFLEDASRGCVSSTFSIPPSLVAQLQDDIRNSELDMFMDIDIESITVNGVVCYEAPILHYTTRLKQLYTSKSFLQPLDDFKPNGPNHLYQFRLARIEKKTLCKVDMDRFTRESLRGDIDDVEYKKTTMELNELGVLPDNSQPKVFLIEGAPGMGKTTFALQQCQQWAEGKVLQAYSIVLLLPLRDNNIRLIKCLPSLFQHSKGKIREEVARTVEESNGKGCLIWLEAWDELPEDLRSDSLFTQLIQGKMLPAATIYITSRPWATRGLLEKIAGRISQHIELLAPAKEEVENQMSRVISDYLESNPVISATMYTPVTATIVEKVVKSASHNPPTTVTQLYSAYVFMTLEHYLTKHHDMNIKVKTLDDLPQGVLQDFRRLCALAYDGVSKQTIVFPSLPKDLSTLGLLQCVPQVYNEGEGQQMSYSFPHNTVREYLAALHLSHMQLQNTIQCLEDKYCSSHFGITHFKETFKFLAGITNVASYPEDFLSKLLEQDPATMYSWLYESQNLPLLINVLGSGERELKLPYTATTTDYFVAGYCLANSNSTWNINLHSIDDLAMQFLSKGCNHQRPETNLSGRIVSASFWSGSITADGVKHFMTIPNAILQHIQHLNLSGNKLERRSCNVLAEDLQRMPSLEKLHLSYNSHIGCGSTVELVSRLHSSKVRELNVTSTGIGDPDFECLANYIRFTTSLQWLSIGGNENIMSINSTASLCKALTINSSLTRLYIIDCHLTMEHCKYLGELLRQPICKIEKLDLRDCSLTGDAVEKLVSGLNHNHTLREFYLSGNQIGSEGAATMAKMLKTNSSLERLLLAECSIGSSGGVELGAALERNKTLRELWLSGNALGDDGVRGLCVGLESNLSLEELHLNGDEALGEEGISFLLKGVEEKNRGLKRLWLPQKYEGRMQSKCDVKCMWQ